MPTRRQTLESVNIARSHTLVLSRIIAGNRSRNLLFFQYQESVVKESTILFSEIFYIINDILKGFHLSENQRRYVYLIQTGKPQLLWPAIRDELTKFVFPIDFLDFENTIDAIPLINRLYPYDAYPFQFSLHVLSRSGTLSHFEYLHQDTSDPRIDVTNKLLEGSAKNYTNDLI